MQGKIIGLNGAFYALLNQLAVWGFETFRSSIMLYWLNKFGVFFITKTHAFLKSLVLSISQMVMFLRPQFILSALMHGGVFCKHVGLLRKV